MSLFKTQDWWSVASESSEEDLCNIGHLVLGNITNEKYPKNKLIIGSYAGSLRIFEPKCYTNNEDDSEVFGFKPDHLVLEMLFDDPILHLAIGRFVSGTSNLHLCILHPNSFGVHSVSIIEGNEGHGSQAKLAKVYQHNLLKTAFGLTIGSFGNVKGRDFIAVQSLDGAFSFFEQESPVFVCQFPEFLIPAPCIYVPSSDSLVTQGSDWALSSYRYQTLAKYGEGSDRSDGDRRKSAQKIYPEWSVIQSESVLDSKVIYGTDGHNFIAILTTRSLSCYRDSGAVKFFKKLEYNPSCFDTYSNNDQIFFLVASHSQNLLVYKETGLIWASQLPFVPVALEKANFKGIDGSIVLLGGNGSVHICFMGTNPSLFVAPPTEKRELDYEAVDKEMAQLNAFIRNSTKNLDGLINLGSGGSKGLTIKTSVSPELESWTGPTNVYDPEGIPCVPLLIQVATNRPVSNVRLDVEVEKPLSVTQDCFMINTICDNCQMLLKCFLNEPYLAPNLTVTVVASHLSVDGTPSVSRHQTLLPLRLVARAGPPQKEAEHKITISTNKEAVALVQLFPDFEGESNGGTATGFVYYGVGTAVTLLSSRTTNRYRIQSDSFAAMWLIFEALKRRLTNHFEAGRSNKEPLCISVTSSSLPLHELLSEIDEVFVRIQKRSDLEDRLQQRTTQFVALQRRLLTKCKDKNPTPLANLDRLIEATHRHIIQLTDALAANKRESEENASSLGCTLRLLAEITVLQAGSHQDIIRAAFFPKVYDSDLQVWLEACDQAVSYLLRLLTGKATRGSLSSQAGQGQGGGSGVAPVNAERLKKRVALLSDALHKHVKIDQTTQGERESRTPLEDFEAATVPPGSRLGEGRARSARVRTSRLISTVREEPEPEPAGSESPKVQENEYVEPTEVIESRGTEIDNEVAGDYQTSPVPVEDGDAPPEPIYAEIVEGSSQGNQKLSPSLEHARNDATERPKTSSETKELGIEAPKDIFGEPIANEGW